MNMLQFFYLKGHSLMIYKFLTDLIAFPKGVRRHLKPQPHKESFGLCNETTQIYKIITHPAKHVYVTDQRNRN